MYNCISTNSRNVTAPQVSVFIPVYNTREYLQRCLDSVLNQSFQDFEIIVVDDCSTDNSLDFLLEYSRKYSRIHVFKNEKNSGVSITSNVAIENCRGRFLARLDSDDMFMKEKLAIQHKFMSNNPEYVLIGGATLQVDIVRGKERIYYSPKTHKEIVNRLFAFNPFQQPTIMVNTDLLPENFIWFDPNLRIAEDLDFVFRILKLGKTYNMEDVLTTIHERPNSLSHGDVRKVYKLNNEVRRRAINKYGYNPGLKMRTVMFCQGMVVRVIPPKFLFSVYYFIRKFY